MSQTLADVERRCRYHLRDRNPQGEAFSSPEYIHAIESNMRETAGRLLLGESLVAGLVTLVAGTRSYALTVTNAAVDSVRHLRSQATGLIVSVVSEDVFEAMREGDVGDQARSNPPLVAMFGEDAVQVPNVVFWPTPSAADTLDGYRSLLPARFFTAGTGTLVALPESTTVPFDDDGFDALCYVVAADLFARMPDADRERLRLAPTAADGWTEKAAAHIATSRHRRLAQKRTDGGNRGGRRW